MARGKAHPQAHRRQPVENAARALSPETESTSLGTLLGLGPVTADGLPVHSLRTLLDDLATLTLNEVTLPASPDHAVPMLAKPTRLLERAFGLLKVDPASDVAM